MFFIRDVYYEKFPSPSAIRGIEPTALIALPLSYMAPNLKTHIQRSKCETTSRMAVRIDTAGFEPASYQRTMPKYVDCATITPVPHHIKRRTTKMKKIIQSVQQG